VKIFAKFRGFGTAKLEMAECGAHPPEQELAKNPANQAIPGAEIILLTCGFYRQVLSDAPREPDSLLFSFPFLLRFATLLWTTAHVHSSQGQ